MRGTAAVLATLSLIASGCLGADAPAPVPTPPAPPPPGVAFDAPVLALGECAELRGVACFEPTIAVDRTGRVFVTPVWGDAIVLSDDGGATWEPLAPPAPPLPAPPGARIGDATLLVDAKDRLWLSAIAYRADLPFGQALAGLVVAWSDDGGETWPVNTYIGLGGPPPSAAWGTDRQWLTVGPDGTAYLAYWQWLGQTGVWVARSADDGRSWSSFERVVRTEERGLRFFSGEGVALPDGVFALPYFAAVGGPATFDGGDTEIRVALTDDGASWRHAVAAVWPADGGPLTSYPNAVVDGAGVLHVAWTAWAGDLLVVSSPDGGETWGEPVQWGRADAEGISVPPWLRAKGGRIDAVWIERTGDVFTLWHARGDGTGPAHTTTVASVEAAVDRITDFAHFALLPDGRAAVPFTDPGQGVMVAVEASAPPAAPKP